MWGIAVGEFLLLKALTLRTHTAGIPPRRVAAYIALWPGMNAAHFLRSAGAATNIPRPGAGELIAALGKFSFGAGLGAWAVFHAWAKPPLLVAWIGMLGIIFSLHFGALHVVSWFWRRRGIDAPPIMRAPIAARSLNEFWAERWNIAFAESARRLLLRPLARRWGAKPAAGFIFLVSGLVHESVISLPARGGWGGPTLYFLLQGAGAWFEKTRAGRRFGLTDGWRGRMWTLAVTATPLPLLFHAPFAERVIVPMFRFLKEVL